MKRFKPKIVVLSKVTPSLSISCVSKFSLKGWTCRSRMKKKIHSKIMSLKKVSSGLFVCWFLFTLLTRSGHIRSG